MTISVPESSFDSGFLLIESLAHSKIKLIFITQSSGIKMGPKVNHISQTPNLRKIPLESSSNISNDILK